MKTKVGCFLAGAASVTGFLAGGTQKAFESFATNLNEGKEPSEGAILTEDQNKEVGKAAVKGGALGFFVGAATGDVATYTVKYVSRGLKR